MKVGDVFKVLELDGRVAEPGHPFIILMVENDMAFVTNLTDIENEDELPCILEPADDPATITKTSTVRYRSIEERPLAKLDQAVASRRLLYCGEMKTAAFCKILNAAHAARNIKPKYKNTLVPKLGHLSTVLASQIAQPVAQPSP